MYLVLTSEDHTLQIEPTFLVAPEPEKPPEPGTSRRAFVAACLASFAVGITSGMAVERLRGSGDTRGDENADDMSERVRWATQLQAGPLDRLVQHHESFLIVFANEPDPRLLHGARRLALAVLEEDPTVEGQRLGLAATLTPMFEASPFAGELKALTAKLRRVR